MAALDAGYDITASGVTLDRFCGSGISSVNFAAASVMSGMEDVVIAGGTEMMSSYAANVPHSPLALPRQRQRPSPRYPSADESGRGRRRHRHTREDRPPSCRRAGGGVTAPGRGRHQGGPLRPFAGPGAPPGRHGRAGSGGVPAPGNHGRARWPRSPVLRGAGRHPARREGHDVPSLVLQKFPGLEITPRASRRQLAPASSMVRRLCSSRAPTTPRTHGLQAPGQGRRHGQHGRRPHPHAQRARARDQEGPRQGGHDAGRHRPVRGQRSLRRRAEKYIRDLDVDREKVNVNGGAIALGHPIGATGSL